MYNSLVKLRKKNAIKRCYSKNYKNFAVEYIYHVVVFYLSSFFLYVLGVLKDGKEYFWWFIFAVNLIHLERGALNGGSTSFRLARGHIYREFS